MLRKSRSSVPLSTPVCHILPHTQPPQALQLPRECHPRHCSIHTCSARRKGHQLLLQNVQALTRTCQATRRMMPPKVKPQIGLDCSTGPYPSLFALGALGGGGAGLGLVWTWNRPLRSSELGKKRVLPGRLKTRAFAQHPSKGPPVPHSLGMSAGTERQSYSTYSG